MIGTMHVLHVRFIRGRTLDVGRWTFAFWFQRNKRHPAFRAFPRMIHHHFGMHHAGVFLLLVLGLLRDCDARSERGCDDQNCNLSFHVDVEIDLRWNSRVDAVRLV